MTINQQPKAAMHAVNSSSDSGALQGARRATGDAPESAAPAKPHVTDSEVVPRARRRQFSNAEKRRIVEAADLAALAPQKRGPKSDPDRADALHIAKLTRDNERLKSRLDKAMLVIEVQKKLATLWGYTLDDNGERT